MKELILYKHVIIMDNYFLILRLIASPGRKLKIGWPYLAKMKRIAKYVLIVTCNNFQPGYPWHRFLHEIFGFEWNPGRVEYNHMTRVRKLFRQTDLNVIEYNSIDTPIWPVPSGRSDDQGHFMCWGKKK